MLVIQIVLSIFFLVAILKAIGRARDKEIPWSEAIVWIFFWVAAFVILLKPDFSYYLAHILGVGRGADAVMYVSLAVIFFIIFRLFVRLEKIERDITKIVRKISLDDKEKK